MPIDNTLTVTTAARDIAQRLLEDLTGTREPDDPAAFAAGLQDGLEAAVAVVCDLGLTSPVNRSAAGLLTAMERTLRLRLDLS